MTLHSELAGLRGRLPGHVGLRAKDRPRTLVVLFIVAGITVAAGGSNVGPIAALTTQQTIDYCHSMMASVSGMNMLP